SGSPFGERYSLTFEWNRKEFPQHADEVHVSIARSIHTHAPILRAQVLSDPLSFYPLTSWNHCIVLRNRAVFYDSGCSAPVHWRRKTAPLYKFPEPSYRFVSVYRFCQYK